MPKKDAPTMKDIAEALHVSTGLVSYVLNGRGDEMRISKDMQRQVQQKAQELHYHANIYAKRIRQQSAYLPSFSFFWPYQSNAELLNAIFEGIHNLQRMHTADFDMMLQLYDKHQLFQYERFLQGNRSNGAMIFSMAANDWDYIEENQFPIPLALLNHYSSRHHCAYVDPKKCMEQTVSLMRQAGYDTIGLLCGMTQYNHRLQTELLRQYCAQAGIHILPSSFDVRPLNEFGGIEAVRSMLHENQLPPRLLLSFSTRMARGAQYALYQLGFRCPQDVHFLVMTNLFQRSDPTLAAWSTIQFPIDQMSGWCIQQLLQAGQSAQPEAREFSAEWLLHDSFYQFRG